MREPARSEHRGGRSIQSLEPTTCHYSSRKPLLPSSTGSGQLTFVKANLNEAHGLKAKKATFTVAQLKHHITELNEEVKRLQSLLGLPDEEMQAVSDESLRIANSEL